MTMELHRPPTRTTPEISFDTERGFLELIGTSIPDNSLEVYGPIQLAISMSKDLASSFEFHMKLEHFNTSSAKCLFDILRSLKSVYSLDQIEVAWYYDEDDEDLLECGEDFSDLLNIEFNFIPTYTEPTRSNTLLAF